MKRYLKITDLTGCRGVRDIDRDVDRAIDAADAVLAGVDLEAAYAAYCAKCNEEPHDAALADIWERADSAANIAFTEGWHRPDDVGFCLAIG